MSTDAHSQDLELTPEAKAKFDELVALLAGVRYGEDGPPRDTTFAEIEQFGHQAGQMLARAIDEQLTTAHAAHFTGNQACPSCGEMCPTKESPHALSLQTQDGDVCLHEPTCQCSSCRRAFFPSENPPSS